MDPTAPKESQRHPRPSHQQLLSRCNYFVSCQLWPVHTELDPERWLSNFTEEEAEHAFYLLNAFLYFSHRLVNRLFVSSVHSLSQHIVYDAKTLADAEHKWRAFLDTTYFVPVTGEIPQVTDSGHLFARMTRDSLGIPEDRIVSAVDALYELFANPTMPLVFIDDFVGSGNQFVQTWTREYTIPGSPFKASFASVLSNGHPTNVYYCPVLCTLTGLRNIQQSCRPVTVSPAHLLGDEYNVYLPADNSVIWPGKLKSTAVAFLESACDRAGIPPGCRRGFHNLGLAVAFAHGVPDATVDLFTWNKNGWKPLIQLQ
jgi:hypothetical protein